MSLLMDALNKAEQAKRENQAADAEAGTEAAKSPSPALTLELTPLMSKEEPAPAAADAPPALPELPVHLGVLDQEFIDHAAAAKQTAKEKVPPRTISSEPPPSAAPVAAKPSAKTVAKPAAAATQKAEGEDREAAQNLFDAKQPRAPFMNRNRALTLGLLALVVAGALGGYVWLQLQPSSGLGLTAPAGNIPRPALPPPPVQNATPAEPVAQATPVVPPLPANAPARPAAAAAPVAEEPPGPVRVSASKIVLNPSLASGYTAYLAGKLDLAQSEYLQVLNSDPSNLDALHGMAAISLRQGLLAAAEDFYLRAIEADPKDALAQAGLIGLKAQIDPLLAETRLNLLLAAQPELPFVHFALGNLYASQNRWNEAQAAFFKAYQGEPDNPDTLFNLAVSLDQLNQPKLAVRYYNLALAAAANRAAGFDKAQVSARLRELQP